MGQKQYIWGIARCYSVDGFKKAQQERTQTLLDYEFKKRMITRDICDKTKLKLWKDYCDYSKVIKNASVSSIHVIKVIITVTIIFSNPFIKTKL